MDDPSTIKPNAPTMIDMISRRRSSWHGFDRSSCQWMMTAEYRDLNDEAVVKRLNQAFATGATQLRMQMNGVNVEAHDPRPIYAFKLVPQSDGQHAPHTLIIRINSQTGQPWDVRRAPICPTINASNALGGLDGQHYHLNKTMESLFDHAAQWHKETFGVGPVAPPVSDSNDVNEATEAMLRWTTERGEIIAARTPQAPSSSPGPRL